MIKTLAHVCILSRDLDKTLGFYGGLLGLRKKFDFMRKGEWFGFYLEVDAGHYVEVFKTNVAEAPAHKLITHLCFEVTDIGSLRQKLTEAGIAVTPQYSGADHTLQFWCKDPDGVDIEFHQYTAASSQFTGRNV